MQHLDFIVRHHSSAPGLTANIRLKAAMLSVLAEFFCAKPLNRREEHDVSSLYVSRALHYVDHNFAVPTLSVTEIAAHLGITPEYLCAVFKQVEGMPLILFANRAKLQHVRALMEKEGLSLQDAAANAFKMDDLIDEKETYAFDGSLGYLCSDPLECGTAMRAYALLFLPALTIHEQIEPLSVKLSGLGLSLRPMMSGTQGQNCLYMLSCRSSLRASEQEMLARMEDTTRQILESERKLCDRAKAERAAYLTDRAMRARAILKNAHLLGADEFLSLSADVRIGISLGILQDISPDLLNTLLVEIMPCTMTLCAEQPLRTAQERDLFRAALVKQRLGA
jgi:protein-arginine kinase